MSLSEELRKDRRERIRQIEYERERERLEREKPKKAIAAAPWDEERVFEREIIYDRPPPPGVKREIRERTYVTR